MSFNPDLETGRRWNKEINSPFLQLMDPATPGTPGDAGATYRKWGFKKSFIGVWSPESLRFYSDQKLGGTELHPALGQDVHRMGGDLILDGNGRVILDHYSKTNQDRPSVDKTLLPLARALDVQRRHGTKQAGDKAVTLNVAGYSSCLFHQKALKHAMHLQSNSGGNVRVNVSTFASHDEYQKWLKDHRASFEDPQATVHKTCPFTWMVNSDNMKEFIGGCDDLLALQDLGGLGGEAGSWIPGETSPSALTERECKS